MKTLNWRWLAIGLSLVLAACASTVPQLSLDNEFARAGRFAVNFTANLEQPYAAQGGFSWRDNGHKLNLELLNPVGSVLAKLQLTNTYAHIKYADGSEQSARNADQLLENIWGHTVPVSGLRYWIQGGLDPSIKAQNVQRDKSGQLISFEQAGWQVVVSDYDDLGPKKLRLLHEQNQQRLSLRFVIN